MADDIDIKLSLDASEYTSAVGSAKKAMKSFGAQTDKTTGKVKKGSKEMSSSWSTFKGVLGAQAVVGAFKAVGSAAFSAFSGMVEQAKDLETIQTQFETLTGSTQEAQKHLADLQTFAASTPFQLEGLAETSKGLQAFGFSSDDALKKMQFLGDVAAATGNPIKDLGQIFGQVSAAGKLTGERLNQLQERGIPVLSELAKELKVTSAEARDMVSKGKVDFSIFETAMKNMANEGGLAFGGMTKQSKTLGGVLSTLGDNFKLIQSDIGKEFLPTFKELASEVIVLIQNNRELIKSFAVGAANTFKEALSGILGVMGFLSDPMSGLIKAFNGLKLVALDAALGILSFGSQVTESMVFIDTAVRTVFAGVIEAWALTVGTLIQGAIDLASTFSSIFNIELPEAVTGFQDNILGAAEEIANGEGGAVSTIKQGFENMKESVKTQLAETEANIVLSNKKIIKEAKTQNKKVVKEQAETEKTLTNVAKESLDDRYANKVEDDLKNLTALQLQNELELAESKKADKKDLTRIKKQLAATAKAEEDARQKELKQANQFHALTISLEERREEFKRASLERQVADTQSGLAAITGLMKSSNKEAFRVGKAASIVNATVDTYKAANAAFSALAGIPVVGPVLGAAAAAGAITAGMANVNNIKSQSFEQGGIVSGTSFTGDKIGVNVNSSEMILNKVQQANLFSQLQSNAGTNTNSNEGMIKAIHELASRPVIVQIDGEAIAQATLDAQSQGFGG